MLHELAVIYQYQVTLLKYLLLDVSVMVCLLSFLLNLLMKSAINVSSSSSNNYVILSGTTPVSSIYVKATIIRLGTKYSIGTTVLRP
jgi:hypothetical protein